MAPHEETEAQSGRAGREDWFKDGGCPKLNNVVRWSVKICERNGVNLANSISGLKLKKNSEITYYCYYNQDQCRINGERKHCMLLARL